MKRIVVLALLLAGCAHKQPGIEVNTVEVPVIRVEKCLAAGDIPKRPADLPKRPANISSALDVAVAKVLEWMSYGAKADAVMRGCAGSVAE